MLMLAQFQRLYPNGSIITELLQIFQGKYIVRASVQIENLTRATAMAGAETVEAAEDQARTRALMVLGINNSAQVTVECTQPVASPMESNPTWNNTRVKLNHPNESNYSPVIDEDYSSSQWSAPNDIQRTLPLVNKQIILPDSVTLSTDSAGHVHTYSPDFHPNASVNDNPPLELYNSVEDEQTITDHQPKHQRFAGNVTPFTPRSSNLQDHGTDHTGAGKQNNTSEPVDLSDVIAKTDVELQRLGWTPEQGRDHLIQAYGKRSRTLLTAEELHGFLKHLESQPDPVAGF
jgi:hypothetical protein